MTARFAIHDSRFAIRDSRFTIHDSPMPRSRLLHVANGHSVTGTLETAGVPGLKSVWADPLHDGPVPDVSDDELLDIRARYLAEPTTESYVETRQGLRRWREVMLDTTAYDELVLWFEHDVFDQLNLIQLLSWIDERLPRDLPVTLVSIDAFPGHPDFKGLGELKPSELAPLLDTRQPVTRDHYSRAREAWHAFRQTTPEAIEQLRRSDSTALPFLSGALTRLLQEYPWTSDGLSRSERRLLRLGERGPMMLNRVFAQMNDDDRFYTITDLALLDLVGDLSSTTPPLVSFTLPVTADRTFRGTLVTTDTGREVLGGRRDRVALGLDRWRGGVHLHSDQDVWRWDEGKQRIVSR
jgi:hypothetical protein